MAKEELETLLTFPFEVELHQRLFEAQPLRIAELFLQCFDKQGVQRLQVPTHVLEAVAERFRRVLDGDAHTLDDAFGGKIRRQRNRIVSERIDYSVAWDHRSAREKAARIPHSQRRETPFEAADEEVAAKHGTSPENIRRIYKRAGKRR
jgi:hypothetical protein